MTEQADTALYGRVTYQMMESYWPTAADKPNATKHDKEHSEWYNRVSKVVLSTTLNNKGLAKTQIISEGITEQVNKLKRQEGKNILIFGSPGAANSLLKLGLIDEFWLFLNPILLGKGIPVFKDNTNVIKLNLRETKIFSYGVIALHYSKE
jgi:dihydrofolate reductase